MQSTPRRTVLETLGTGVATLVVGTGTALACDDDEGETADDGDTDDDETDDARVRVAHASPDAPAVDAYVDADPEEDDPTVGDLEFTDVTDYLSLPPGEYEVTITDAGDTEPVPPTPATLELEAEAYTVAALGELSPEDDEAEFAPTPFVDDLDDLADGEGRVRVYHAVPDAPAVDVRVVDGPTIADELTFGDASESVDVAADTYPVAVYPAGCEDPVLGPADVEVRDGEVLSVFAMGNLDPEELESGDPEPEFQLVLAYADADGADDDADGDDADGDDDDGDDAGDDAESDTETPTDADDDTESDTDDDH